jgi:sarcosine oxidase subunit alpha
MATDQGKTSNMNGLAIAAGALNKSIPEVGLTTFRTPFTPVTFGTLAGHSRGDLFDPIRRTPMHGWAEAQGAAFEDVGQWKRAWYFPREGETMHAAVNRECLAVRQDAGIFDATTLGKIEVVGPDAAEFMERLYTNPWVKLGVGRCRYGLMLNEAGFVMDDGVIGRMAPDRFHVTTTTGGAPRVLAHMEDYLQTEFPELKVWLTSTTEQWAVIAIQGPRARDVLALLIEGIDVSAAAMPHMSLREGKICGVPTRLFRVSFTGELGFEVNVPADFGRAVWEAIVESGRPHGLTPYGTEAMHVLRAEKGYIIVGQETDGTVTPSDLGLDWAIGKAKRDFVGKRSLRRVDLVKPDRKQLVGLLTVDPSVVLDEGAQITADAAPRTGAPALGHVTSSYWSTTLSHSIALAIISRGRARIGETLYAPMPNGAIALKVTDPIFFDKKGGRLDA